MIRSALLIGTLAIALSACNGEPEPVQYGPNPNLPEPQRGLLPGMKIPRPANWGNDLPKVPQGYKIQAIATDLRIPRQTLVLPNGDILVAEGSGGDAPTLRPKDLIAGFIKSLGKSSVEGRQSADAAARRRRRRHLRDAGRLRRQSQRALRPRAGQRRHLRRQPGCAGALRLS